MLFIGRLHPKKGIENLLQALEILGDESLTLTIYGSGDESYLHSLHQLVHKLGIEKLVSFQGHVSGERKMKAFIKADVCIVPSFTENFGMVVAEALAHGVPVIASKGTPWEELMRRGCGLWVENTPDSLAQAVTRISEGGLEDMGRKGREWMKEVFSWDSIAHRMMTTYFQLTGELN